MAWTLNLLAWIVFVTSDAHNCKHAAGFISGGVPYPYDYLNSNPLTQPLPQHDSINMRASDLTANVEEQARITKHQAYSRIDTGSRRGQTSGQDSLADKVIFPGPTSRTQSVKDDRGRQKPSIPEECKQAGYCEKIIDYPREIADKIIATLPPEAYQVDELSATPDIMQRFGPIEEDQELCSFDETVLYPQAALDEHGEWQIVLNSDVKPVQGIKAEICNKNSPGCASFVFFQPSYNASCVQKFTFRKLTVVTPTGDKLDIPLKVPTCCVCVAKYWGNNKFSV